MKTPISVNHPSRCLDRPDGWLSIAIALVLLLASPFSQPAVAADEAGLSEKAEATAQEAGEAVKNAERSVTANAEQLWQRIDAARLKNRTPDEIVAWLIMGVVVGAVAGMMTSLKSSGLGKLGRLLLGLAGAFLGGMVVRVTHLDFGWGFVLITYEELAFSFLGAILLIVVVRLIRRRTHKRAPGQAG